MPKGQIRGAQIKDDSITEDDIHDDAIKHFVYGSADLNDNNKPVNWINASNISPSTSIKSWFIAPFNCKIDKIIATVKGNSFDTATDGNFTVEAYINQQNFDTAAISQTVGCDDFIQKVSNMAGGTIDCNQKIFSSLNTSLSEGDLLQVKVNKTAGDEREITVTVVFT